MSKAKEVSLVAMMSSACIVGRWACSSLPNISPMTSLLIVITQLCGLSMGVKVAIVSTLISNLLLGMGVWTIYQILAWLVVVILASLIPYDKKELTFYYHILAGFVFGFIVSLEKLLYGGLDIFWFYYANGVIFDTLHAFGNMVFYPVVVITLGRVLNKQQKAAQ